MFQLLLPTMPTAKKHLPILGLQGILHSQSSYGRTITHVQTVPSHVLPQAVLAGRMVVGHQHVM
jgi:hypothetical protein